MVPPERSTSNRHDQRGQEDERTGDTRHQALGAELSEIDLPQERYQRESPGVAFRRWSTLYRVAAGMSRY